MSSEIEHYATSFAVEIRKQFASDIAASATGLASSHGLDSVVVESQLWQGISEDLSSGPEPDLTCIPEDEQTP